MNGLIGLLPEGSMNQWSIMLLASCIQPMGCQLNRSALVQLAAWPPHFYQSRSESPGLGKVMLQHAPFLRMYADYVRNFDQAMELVRTWTERSSAFRNIIQDIQVNHTRQQTDRYLFLCIRKCRGRSRMFCMYGPVFLESGGVLQPDPAAPHVRASPEGPTLWDAAQGLPEETVRG